MFISAQTLRRSSRDSESERTDEIGELYRRLSLSLDRVRSELLCSADLNQTICLTVIEEDLSALLEECEVSLLDAEFSSRKAIESLESRGDTILEELELMLGSAGERSAH